MYRDGKLHGPQRRFYVDDRVSPQIAAESWYKEGVLHGRCFGWHPKTASLILDIPYKDGKRHGKGRSWNEKGILTSEVMMVHGVLDGTMKTYHPTLGTLARSQEWRQGVRDGIDFLYHEEEGFLLFCEEWRSGVKVKVIAEDLLEKNLHEKIKSE